MSARPDLIVGVSDDFFVGAIVAMISPPVAMLVLASALASCGAPQPRARTGWAARVVLAPYETQCCACGCE